MLYYDAQILELSRVHQVLRYSLWGNVILSLVLYGIWRSGAKRRRWNSRNTNYRAQQPLQPVNSWGDAPPRRDPFLDSSSWHMTRYEAIRLCGERCCHCGATPANGAAINVDHIRPRHLAPERALDLTNLQVLCAACNDGKWGKDGGDHRTDAQRAALAAYNPTHQALISRRIDFYGQE